MLEWIRQPWPWYVAGPLIGLTVPALLLIGNRMFGISSNLRTLCAVVAPMRIEYFRFDWRSVGAWNLAFAGGILVGGAIAATALAGPSDVAISAATRSDLIALGVTDFHGLVPDDVFSWGRLLSPLGLILTAGGGLLVGFGAAWAGGCTSGHAIMGLADGQVPSLIAVSGFFIGGLITTHLLLPLLFAGLTP